MSLADAPARIAQACRTLRRTPGASAASALALTIGIAANTIVFSIVDAALLRPPPFDDPDSLVFVGERSPQSASLPASYPDYLDWRARNAVFESIAVHDRRDIQSDGQRRAGAGQRLQRLGVVFRRAASEGGHRQAYHG